MAKLDVSKLEAKERAQLEALLAKTGTSIAAVSGKNPLSDPAYRKKCKDLREQFTKTAMDHGVTFEHVISVAGKIYENPTTGEVYMKGKKPKWLEGNEVKYLVA